MGVDEKVTNKFMQQPLEKNTNKNAESQMEEEYNMDLFGVLSKQGYKIVEK